jgi:hypothetical protein
MITDNQRSWIEELKTLAAIRRQVILDLYNSGLSVKEIAIREGKSRAWIYAQLSRAGYVRRSMLPTEIQVEQVSEAQQ